MEEEGEEEEEKRREKEEESKLFGGRRWDAWGVCAAQAQPIECKGDVTELTLTQAIWITLGFTENNSTFKQHFKMELFYVLAYLLG